MEHIDDYFDLHDILASTCRISCKLECSIQNVGSIVSGNSSQHLPSGSNIDLPLWLVKDLSRRENIIKFDCPKYFKKSYREIQDADPKVLNLRKMGPYFFSVGIKFSDMSSQDSTPILESLHKIFQIRLRTLFDHCLHSLIIEDKDYTNTLDITELTLYSKSNTQNKKFQDWKYKPTVDIMTSQSIEKNRKRKSLRFKTSDVIKDS